MSSLPPNASRDEIEEELVFVEVMMESLDEHSDNYAEQLAPLQAQKKDLEQRLDGSQAGSRPQTAQSQYQADHMPGMDGSHDHGNSFWQATLNGRPGSNGSQTSLNHGGVPVNYNMGMHTNMNNAMQPNGMKRPLPYSVQSESLHPSKRPTPEPSNAGTPASSTDSFDWLDNTGFELSDRSVRRQMAAEAELRRQREDERYARSLMSQPNNQSSFASSSRPSIQTTLNHTGSYHRPPPPPRPQPEPQRTQRPVHYPNLPMSNSNFNFAQPGPSIKPEPGLPVRQQQQHPVQHSGETEVVDLTNSDDEDLAEIAPNRFSPNRRTQNTTFNRSNGIAAPNGIARPNLPMPPAHPQMPTYNMPGAFPNTNQAMYIPVAQNRYPSMNQHPQSQYQQPNSLLSSTMNAVNSIRGVTGMLGNTFHDLNNLINGSRYQSRPRSDDEDDDDDLVYGGSRQINPGPAAYAGYTDMDLYQRRRDEIANYDPTKTAEEINALLENIRPDEEMPSHLRIQTPEAMAVKLHKYQELGLTWLHKQEDSSNKGGILADDMGLGKTIQMLSLLVTRRSEDPRCKTNLIIAPVALMRQWKQEIEQKVKPGAHHRLTVFVHHATTKAKNFHELSHYDVVLTTFGSLASELKKMEKFQLRRKQFPETRPNSSERCVLISEEAHWYRVILDEAQCIKNVNTQTAKAACFLKAKFRFCMTGTPMMNNINELHSLIKFLRIKPYNEWTRFRAHFVTPLKNGADPRAMQKLQVLCKSIMMRRTKKSTFEGQPILVLPERSTHVENPEFSDDEKSFYQALETQTQLQFNKYLRQGTVGSSYSAILVLLLRLRQACCHPHLIKDFGVSAAADMSPETLIELAKQLDSQVVERIRSTDGNFECPVCYDAVTNPAIFIPCGHDTCSDCFARIADPANAIRDGNENAGNTSKAKCPNCRGEIDSKKITDWDSFKKAHMPEELTEQEREQYAELHAEDDEDSDSDSDSESDSADEGDDVDRKTGNLKDFIVDDGEVDSETDSQADEDNDIDDDDGAAGPSVKANARTSAKGKAKAKPKSKKSKKAKGKKKDKDAKKKNKAITLADLKKLATRSKKAHKKYMKKLREDWITSAKIEKTLEKLNEIMTTTDEKVLIFSQWTSLLDLLEVPIDGEGWGYRRYDGSMNAKSRGDAVDDFRDPKQDIRIMLVSLKAGNAGLNLNAASHVIVLDPFWNPYIEEQAIDRAHRLGQTRDVKVHRILVSGTVEDRIIDLQEKKRALISEALDEKAGQNIARLGVQELAYLFGVTRNASERVNYVPAERRR